MFLACRKDIFLRSQKQAISRVHWFTTSLFSCIHGILNDVLQYMWMYQSSAFMYDNILKSGIKYFGAIFYFMENHHVYYFARIIIGRVTKRKLNVPSVRQNSLSTRNHILCTWSTYFRSNSFIRRKENNNGNRMEGRTSDLWL